MLRSDAGFTFLWLFRGSPSPIAIGDCADGAVCRQLPLRSLSIFCPPDLSGSSGRLSATCKLHSALCMGAVHFKTPAARFCLLSGIWKDQKPIAKSRHAALANTVPLCLCSRHTADMQKIEHKKNSENQLPKTKSKRTTQKNQQQEKPTRIRTASKEPQQPPNVQETGVKDSRMLLWFDLKKAKESACCSVFFPKL